MTDTTEAIDTTEVDELGLEFLGIFTEFAPADSAFTLGSWVTEERFVSQYESPRTFQGEGITSSNASFASNLPTETNWDTPYREFTCD